MLGKYTTQSKCASGISWPGIAQAVGDIVCPWLVQSCSDIILCGTRVWIDTVCITTDKLSAHHMFDGDIYVVIYIAHIDRHGLECIVFSLESHSEWHQDAKLYNMPIWWNLSSIPVEVAKGKHTWRLHELDATCSYNTCSEHVSTESVKYMTESRSVFQFTVSSCVSDTCSAKISIYPGFCPITVTPRLLLVRQSHDERQLQHEFFSFAAAGLDKLQVKSALLYLQNSMA